jgi:hypothetical protein
MSSFSRRSFLRAAGLGLGAAALSGLPAGATGAGTLARTVGARVAAGAPALTLVRVTGPISGRQAAVLAGLDDTHRPGELLLWPGDAQRLVEAGIPHEVVVGDLLADARQDGRVPLQPGQRDGYRDVDDYHHDLAALAAAHPDKARLIALPHPSLLGRRITGIEIASDVDRRDGRPVVHHDGMHHCREWPSGEMPMMWAHDLLESYGSDPRITAIVDGSRTIIAPLVNPDGYVRTRRSPIQVDSSNVAGQVASLGLAVGGLESYWRKNLRSFSDVPISAEAGPVAYDNPDAYGIDLNRNYPFLWGDDAGSSSNPTAQTHRGAAPYSEPESRNVRDLVLGNLPITKATHHTYGELMLYAWGRNPNEVQSPDRDLMHALGEAMATFNGYRPQQAFQLYPTSGTNRDWAHAATSSIVYTFEHDPRQFHGPYEATIPAMYEKNRGAFLLLSEAAMDPGTHLVVTGRVEPLSEATGPARIEITKRFSTPTHPGDLVEEEVRTSMLANDDGTFTYHLPPSSRPFLSEPRFAEAGFPSSEEWTLTVRVPGREPKVLQVGGGRGDAVDLGVIDV